MNREFPPDIERQLRQQMAAGHYASENDLIREALQALKHHNEDLAAIRAGLNDLENDQIRPLGDVASDIRRQHGWPQQSLEFQVILTRQAERGLSAATDW